MALKEFESALAFYEKFYGVRIPKTVEPVAAGEKPALSEEMRRYFANNGRKGGKSRSAAKVASSARNINLASGRQA
jgi:hypothetical protein